MRHILSVADLSRDELLRILDRAAEWKSGRAVSALSKAPLAVFLLERATFRTRLAYEAALMKLGGNLVTFEGQLEARESIEDVAHVVSEMADVVLVRVGDHGKLEALADAASVPIVNALTAREHPVEVLADALTIREAFDNLSGRRFAFIGDGGNVCQSLLLLAPKLGMDTVVATPDAYAPDAEILSLARKLAEAMNVSFDVARSADEAADGASVIYTDAWPKIEDMESVFELYRVDAELFAKSEPDAIFLHCLPAKRGQEVTADVIDGPQSHAFRRLENLIHTSTALLEWLLEHVE